MAEQTSAKYWDNTEVLETFMTLMYEKVKRMVNKKISTLETAIGSIENKANECKAALLQLATATKTEITATKTAAETSIATTKTAAETSIATTKTQAAELYNTYSNRVIALTESLTEAIMTQTEYDTLINSYDPETAPTTPGQVTTSTGETWYYLPNAIMTPYQKSDLIKFGQVTTTYSGESKTWYYCLNGTDYYACDAVTYEASTVKVPIGDVLGKGVFTTYYIVEE